MPKAAEPEGRRKSKLFSNTQKLLVLAQTWIIKIKNPSDFRSGVKLMSALYVCLLLCSATSLASHPTAGVFHSQLRYWLCVCVNRFCHIKGAQLLSYFPAPGWRGYTTSLYKKHTHACTRVFITTGPRMVYMLWLISRTENWMFCFIDVEKWRLIIKNVVVAAR